MNVIWIIADTFRRDHLGCYGNKTIHTPSLDALAAKSVRFDRHYAASFPTMPARADYLTGCQTACFMGWAPLPEGRVTLANILRKKRVHTAAVVDTPFYLRDNMNYDRGFRTFIEVPGQEVWLRGLGRDVRRAWRFESDCFAPQTFKKSMEWLEQHYKEDFFLYIDTWDPHEPWEAPNYYTELYWPGYDGQNIFPVYNFWQKIPGMTEELVKKAHACYCGEITMVDTWVGYLLRQIENMGLMESTAIIFTTDHGFYFGEHGGRFGKANLGRLTDVKAPIAAPRTGERSLLYEILMSSVTWERSPLFEEAAACPLLIYAPGVSP
ncbi:MAG: sulfatase, partial [Dehalococcoidia bacterium]|nr:sulfatase [Dehalococcoidia bacterium]